jgi:flotillin
MNEYLDLAAVNAGSLFWIGIIAVFAVLIFFSFIILLTSRYKRCPSNAILVIFGKVGGEESAKCIHGGAAFVWPLIQNYAYLGLEPIQIEVPLKDALSIENIRVNVPSVFTVAIGTAPEVMQNAAIRLLDLDTPQIKKQAEDIIFGQLRQVIASMQIEDINRDREKFLLSIQSSLEPELEKIGLVLINVNITDITDESGYIEAIGRKAASQAIQQARGDVADQEKLGEIRVAEAERDKHVSVAEANKLRLIGVRAAERDKSVKIAQLDRDQQVGEQQAAFQRDMQVKEADREKRISVANANAHAIDGETASEAQIAAAQANLQVKRAEAYEIGETRKREAEAAVLEAQNRAMAKAALAEAERVEAERRAALEAPAKAQKAKVIVDAEAEAQRKRIDAEADAAAIFARLEAEAKGQFETLAKKGDGLQRIIDACGGSQQAFQMLMLEHLEAITEKSAQAISKIKFDKVIVWEGGGANGTSSTANFLQNLAHTMPPILQVLKEVGGVEIPEYFAKLTPDGEDGPTAASPVRADGPPPGPDPKSEPRSKPKA